MTDVEPSPLPDGFVCEPGTVPGWLDSDGLPTSCIGDLPNPGDGVTFTAEPAPVEPAPAEPAPVEPAPVEPAPAEPAPVEPAPMPTESTVAIDAPLGVGGIASLPETGAEPALLIALAVGIAAGALGVALLRRESRKGKGS